MECTVKYLASCLDIIDGEYAGTWHDEIEDALGEDSKETRERLAGLNSRRDAMNEVRVYLKEAWEMMGPSFLETVAATEKKNDDGACMEDVAMHYENQEPLEESVDVN
ncbi:hypothetical protein GYH30_039883 [Glycine max]|nr:hypothetical protein GYH30_039883 [Glycine max]